MRQFRRIITIAIVLCITSVNTGALHAIHIHQYCGSGDTEDHGGQNSPNGGHDAEKCSICIQLASLKAVSPEAAEHISTVPVETEKAFLPRPVFPSEVCLSSQLPRAPPFIS